MQYIKVYTMPVWYIVVYDGTSRYENLIPGYTGIYEIVWSRIQFQHCSAYKCITYSVLPNARIWQYNCTLGFKTHFKLVGDQNGDVMP